MDGTDDDDIHAARGIPLDGAFNFRDLGGLRTRDGRRVRAGCIFRSDALHHLSPRDLARVRDDLGLRVVIDLRSTQERSGEPTPDLCAPPVAAHHVPIFERDAARDAAPSARLDELYFGLLQIARAPIARVLALLAETDAPAVFHCAAGKDRTGIVAAALLGALGVADEDVIGDYAETRRSLERIHERLRASESYQYVFTALPPETLHAEPGTMMALLRRVRGAHGSMRGYLQTAGVTDAILTRLAARLVEDA